MSGVPALPAAVLDRGRGALLGLAVGDALGTTLEFSARDSLPHQTEMTGGGPFGLAPGQWTDDTAMALALADALLAGPALDPRDLMQRFARWHDRGENSCTGTCFDVGTATRAALLRFARTGDPLAGDPDPATAGNGSLMRLAPVALRALGDPEEARRLAVLQGRTTHAAPLAVEGCALLAAMLEAAIHGDGRDAVLAPRPWAGAPEIAALAAGTWRGRPRGAIRSSGYVLHTLEAALWAVERTGSFEEAVVLAVNLGDDADTVGAVAGQLAGALHGASAIPRRWLDRLAWRDHLLGRADALLARSPMALGRK